MTALSSITTTATVPDLWDRAVEALKEKDKQNVDFQRADKRAILVDVLREVQSKKQACIGQRLKYKRSNGDSVLLYDVYGKIVNWVNTFKEIGDTAVQYDPGHDALPWAAVRFLLQVSVNDVQIFGSLVEGLEVVCKTIARYAAIEKLYFRQPSSVENLLEGSIIATYTSILRFLSKCRKYFELGLTRRVVRSITQLPENVVTKHLNRIANNDRKVSDLTKIVDPERSQWNGAQQLSTTNNINNLANGLQDLRVDSTASASKLEVLLAAFKEPVIRTVEQASALSLSLVHSHIESREKEERLRILLWLSNIQYKKHHQSLSKGSLEGTGSWLLEKPQFVEWRNSSVSSVLWLHGIPGSGKTCLMSIVIRQLLIETSTCENAAPIAYFYCQRNSAEPQRSDPTEVLRAILKQLLCYDPQWWERSSTANVYRERKIEADKDGSEVSRLDLRETIDQIIEITSRMPVTIVIDALDECRSDWRHELLKTLEVLLEKSAQLVKVFVSSRDDIDIVLRLQKDTNVYININDNKGDIHRYIQFEIQKAQTDRRLLKGVVSPDLVMLVTESLAMKAEGMFLWVSLQIESLCDSRRIKLEGDLVDELARFPLSLAGIYSLILRNIGRIERRGRTVAETIFRWLLCTDDAGCDVTIAACSGTASTEGRSLSISDILDVCSNLVVYEEALDRFRFAHLSVREFLESQPGYTPIAANEFVLERSLQRLTYQQTNRDPFWSYATLHWGFHYNRLGELHRKEVFELHAKRFLFNGVESSDAFNVWATEVHKLNWDLLESKSFHSPQLYIVKGNFRSPVELASYFGWLEILDHFKGNQSSNDIYGPAAKMMTVAIRSGQTSVVRWLLDRSFYPMDEHLKQAFHYQRLEIVQTFLDMNFLSPNTIVGGEEVLSLVIRCSLGDLYQDLIKKGANVHHRDEHGRTLLFHAVSSPANNHSKIIEDLLLTGIDPSAQDNAGRTPLSLSLWGKHQPRFYSLLACKVYHYSTSTNGEDVLRRVSQSYDYHIACLLLHYGLDSMLKDVDMRAEWMEILSLIATHPDLQCEAMASLARRSGKLSNGPEDQMQLAGQTLLSLAALLRHEKAFRVLLNWGIDPTCPAICEVRKKTSIVSQIGHCMSRPEPLNHKGESNDNRMSDELRQGPLAWAAYSGNIPLVQSIIERALDANIKNRKGQTALYFAVQHTEDNCFDSETDKDVMVRLLLQKGALVTSADDYGGATLLAHAFKARSGTMVKLLLENGAEIPRGALVGPAEQLWDAFHQGQDGIRQALLERIQGAQVDSMHRQSPSSTFDWSGDPLGTAAQFIWGGTMRVFGDVLLTACGDIDNAT